MPNARLNDRAPFFAEVDVLAAGTPAPRRVWGTDVSETGMFIQTTHPFRVGDRVSLRFDCETTPVHVRAAEVMWVRPFEPISVDGSMPGVGLKFVALDPPSRAALRRFVAPHLVDTTLPETPASDLDPLPPPVASLPPITGSIVMKTTGKEPKQVITDEMIAVSLPPFTDPPFKNTKPMGTPAPITIGPRRLKSTPPASKSVPPAHESMPPPSTSSPAMNASMSLVPAASLPPHPLAGWTFRKEDAPFFENETTLNAVSGPPQGVEPHAMQKMGLDLRFDDAPPAGTSSGISSSTSGVFASMSSFTGSLPPDEARLFEMSNPPLHGDNDAASHISSEFNASAPPITQVPDEDAIVAVEQAVVQGDLAIKHLPIARDRRSSPKVSVKSRALPMAFVLLCSGTLVGVVVGTVVKRMKAHVPIALATAEPIPAPTLAPPAPAVVAPPAVPLAAEVEQELVAPKPAGPIVSAPPPVKDAALPRKTAPEAAETTLASTTPVAPAQPKNVAADAKQVIEVNVGDAKLVKAFTLASPSRVVVDLAGGKLPKAPMLNPGEGVSRVRFGSPAPGTGRVVVELDRDGKANGVETWVSRGVLTVTFK